MVVIDRGCPNCGANEVLVRQDQKLVCRYCGTAFGNAIHVCPSCGHYNEKGLRHCARCGASLVRDCPDCGAENWILATRCTECGRDLGMIERLTRRWQQTTQQRLHERKASMASLKAREEWASQVRMASIMDLERHGLARLGGGEPIKRPSDRPFLRILAVLVALVFVAVILTLLLGSGGV
jgi:uncharacterized membrane protein YvbJ